MDDLCRRQNRRLAEGGHSHSKLPGLLDLKPTTVLSGIARTLQVSNMPLQSSTGSSVHRFASAAKPRPAVVPAHVQHLTPWSLGTHSRGYLWSAAWASR